MPRDRDALALSTRFSVPLLPLALAAAAIVAGLLASQQPSGGAFAALALVLVAAACTAAGAMWARQRQLERVHEARLQHHLLSQLTDAWLWQTDAEHRLLRLQPPLGAPASSWAVGASSGQLFWERFAELGDAASTLPQRMQAHAPLAELRVRQAQATDGRTWSVRGLPHFDGRGRFAGYVGLARPVDASECEAFERRGFEALMQDAPIALCTARCEPASGRLVLEQANPAARRLLGLAADAPSMLPWEQALAGLPDELRERVQSLEPGHVAENDGWVAWLADLAQDGESAPRRLLALAVRESDGAAQSLAAEHAAFSYTVSHDLRAPIRVVEGFARILKEDYGRTLDRIGNDHLDRVLSAAARMNHMIDALLSLSQLTTQPLQRQPVNLSQLAQFIVDDLRRMAPERDAEVRIQPDLTVQGDPTLLRMVLENLLGNAWKYSSKTAHTEITFELTQHAGREAYVVRDNGAGFDMRFADRLFGLFQRLHSSGDFQGTGLGLASVRRIVRRHGGEIWAESEVGQGARFYFTLPTA